ncbi:MAG: geranylgeranylglyceryl phosphate synthase [Crocinitomicaceae bacterium]|jgi:putative glycerol-1-phosphate prenyltransferase|nr:geranylgeranylglyceryl phosphate synthase [Crocinitomicaceae bacterium]
MSGINLFQQFSARFGQIAVLIDPEKTNREEQLLPLALKAEFAGVSYFFVGGSTVSRKEIETTISLLKKLTQIPVVIFPGGNQQLSAEADGILYLSLVSGRNPDFLITHHVNSALEVFQLGIEVIPTGYILVDGGTKSSVAYVSQTTPIPCDQKSIAVSTALAAVLQGKKVIYFDAGSGAKDCVPAEFISELRKYTDLPVIVGGGIRDIDRIRNYHESKTNVIVIGNRLEENLDFLLDIQAYVKNS